jgi:UPF0755 protein
MKHVKHYQHVFIVCFCFMVGAMLLAAVLCYRFIKQPLLPAHGSFQTIKIYQGDQLSSLVRQMHDRHLLLHPWAFILYAKWHHFDKQLQVGEYAVEPGIKAFELLKNITQGNVVVHKIQFIEGWTLTQFLQAIANDSTLKHTLTNQTGADIMNQINSRYHDPEGLFFPDTYAYTWGDSDLDILERAYHRMESVLKFEWLHRQSHLLYRTPYQALIVASLVEKEAKVDNERAKIAGVILRRVKLWMHLQIDAAINYGLDYPYGRKLTKADLKQDTPYNTYLHYRLPPTPICMPGRKSIYAALHPVHDDTLYYVSKGDGTHIFSKTYAEQQQAIKKYQLKSKKRVAYAETN